MWPKLTEVPPDTHKPCRKTPAPRFPCTPSIRHCFPSKRSLGFSVRSDPDLECAEITCFPSRDDVSITEGNDQNACCAWVWDRPVRALSAYAYWEALPLVPASKGRHLRVLSFPSLLLGRAGVTSPGGGSSQALPPSRPPAGPWRPVLEQGCRRQRRRFRCRCRCRSRAQSGRSLP